MDLLTNIRETSLKKRKPELADQWVKKKNLICAGEPIWFILSFSVCAVHSYVRQRQIGVWKLWKKIIIYSIHVYRFREHSRCKMLLCVGFHNAWQAFHTTQSMECESANYPCLHHIDIAHEARDGKLDLRGVKSYLQTGCLETKHEATKLKCDGTLNRWRSFSRPLSPSLSGRRCHTRCLLKNCQ